MRYHFIIFILTLFGPFCFSQVKQVEPPRLVVGIKVDGLQSEHLRSMWNYFTPGGFRKIISESVAIEKMRYNIVSAGNASDVATLMTGTYPFFHGIIGDYFYNRAENQEYSILFDKNQNGIGTKDKFSAHRLLTSTFTDELKLNSPQSMVHSVSIDSEDAIMMGGHTANSVSWIDDASNRWATTTYYSRGLSRWADMMNVDGSFKKIVDTKWTPAAAINTYINPTAGGSKSIGFSYNPNDRQKGNASKSILKNTPSANTLVAELTRTIFEKEQLGTDKFTDVLMLQFTVKIPNQIASSLVFAEQEDIYIRLDREIQTLLSLFSSRIGDEKMLVFLVGNGSDYHSPVELGKNQIPAGLFNADRAIALLNTYLMAIYGQEKWISGYYGKNIYLNKSKIDEKKINLAEIQNKITDFLLEFEGIQAAYTSQNVINFTGDFSDPRAKFRNSFHKKTSGDIVISLMPGWIEVDNKGRVVGQGNNPQLFIPFYMLGSRLKAKSLSGSYNITDIAPTISKLVGIPAPNGSVGSVIELNP
ncbi:MAG: alkaline phosphatase family protein [Porphyromonadaceae bacterium]|nr:alkaline phosphatase family protein [Porphyromonadaceae bacterium]